VFAFDDDYSFGILQSSVHRAWFEARCTTLGQALRYTPGTVFDSFPWPQAPSIDQVGRVVDSVEALLTIRDSRARFGITVGQQYDSIRDPGESPLRDVHTELDAAVMAAYGFDPDDDVLVQLLALNQAIASDEAEGVQVRGPGDDGLTETRRTKSKITAPLQT
jgi:MmeI, target recognition domain